MAGVQEMSTLDLSAMAVTIQAVGTLLLGLMLLQLGRIFGRSYATRWAIGFGCLSLGLFAVWLYVRTTIVATWPVYLVAEWTWLLMLWAGCRELVSGTAVDLRPLRYALPASIAVATVMTYFSPTFDDLFIVQAVIVSIGVIASFRALSAMPLERRDTGWRTMRVTLLIQAVIFAAYAPMFAYHENVQKIAPLGYSSVIDLLVAISLGFGMLLTTAEETNRVLNAAMSRLDDARSQLEVKLQTDPLTEALSRHAFYSMQRGDEIETVGELHGVVVMIDVDNLKHVNDDIGHAAGDVVIRSSANAIRQLIRADDLLFRWGGDEFVAILPNSTIAAVTARLTPLEDGIVAHISSEHPAFRFRLTWGACEFGTNRTLDEAIRVADAAMYEKRRIEDEAEAASS